MFDRGDRVTTPLGPGTVAYQRMAPPTYSVPEAVSVVLDDRRLRPGYSGTIFPAAEVFPEATREVCEHGYAQGCRGCDPDGLR